MRYGCLTRLGCDSRPWIWLGVVALLLGIVACRSPLPEGLIEDFRAVSAQLASEVANRESMAVRGLDDWLFFGPELRHVSVGPFWGPHAVGVSRAHQSDSVDPLQAILDFKQQLDLIGVELLVVPVPPKSLIYPDKVSSSTAIPIPVPRLDTAHQTFYAILREQDVQVLDLTERFLDDRFHPDGPLYCRLDTHWSGNGCVVTAREIAAVVKDRPWYAELETRAYSSSWYTVTITGDLALDLGATDLPHEELSLRGIVDGTEAGTSTITPDPNSPIVLLGDSHSLIFHAGQDMHATGAGLADQLAFELGMPMDLVAVRGSGATPARINLLRRAQRTPTYWEEKRLVIWCFAAREFTESDGWHQVPIQP